MENPAPIYELHINPTYAVCIPQFARGGRPKTAKMQANELNLKNNDHGGQLSKKAIRRLSNAVNWLVASAEDKRVFDNETQRSYKFKLNFITLTLPTTDHDITDHFFKSVMLHNFINTCRYRFGLRNYVWKVETQANGNIHAHFTTDTFIHWRALRDVWNRILAKNDLIQPYHEKHKNLSFEDYNNLYNSEGKYKTDQVKKAFNAGVASNWLDPNSTDVHAVYKVKDIAAYLAKYMSKSEEGRRKIKGRLWGCSYNLSENNKLVVELAGTEGDKIFEPLTKSDIDYKPIQIKSAFSSAMTTIGEMFFYKISDWGTKLTGRLLEIFNEHRFNIRHNIDIKAIKSFVVESLEPPEPIEIFEDLVIEPNQLACPF